METIIRKYFSKSVNTFKKVIKYVFEDLESSSNDSDED